ncbi:MAG: IS481 family transposase [Actinobacteria bacterium]|nr:IS481 family transposase [Actinomycetota bacterium]
MSPDLVRVPDNRAVRFEVVVRVPWSRTNPTKERVKFALEWEKRWDAGEGRMNLAELCREYGISRETGYVWLRRYRAAGHQVEALGERSHRPHTMPNQVPQDVVDFIVAARKYRPKWGPRKLRAHLVAVNPGFAFPSESTFAAILHRNGLTNLRRRKRRRLVVPSTRPFAAAPGPNAVWCVDFKGWFRTADGRRCYPLTLIDAYSRYLLRCEALLDPDTEHVQPIFDSAFQEFGTPESLRSDNGPPFASTGAGGLTTLSVWWQRLGIRHDRIDPGKPQQNGRLERFHRTLAELVEEPESDVRAQQRAFDRFRHEYNHVRPHEALGLKPPLSAYEPAPRRYPRKLEEYDYPSSYAVERVDKQGYIRWAKHRVLISAALAHEYVSVDHRDVDEDEDECWVVRWGSLELGWLSERRPARGLIQPPRKRR